MGLEIVPVFVRLMQDHYDTGVGTSSMIMPTDTIFTDTIFLMRSVRKCHEILLVMEAHRASFAEPADRILAILTRIDEVLHSPRTIPPQLVRLTPDVSNMDDHIAHLRSIIKNMARSIFESLSRVEGTSRVSHIEDPRHLRGMGPVCFSRVWVTGVVHECLAYFGTVADPVMVEQEDPSLSITVDADRLVPFTLAYMVAIRHFICQLLFLFALRVHFDIIVSALSDQLKPSQHLTLPVIENRISRVLEDMEKTRREYVTQLNSPEDAVVPLDFFETFGVLAAVRSRMYKNYVSIAKKIVDLLSTDASPQKLSRLSKACARVSLCRAELPDPADANAGVADDMDWLMRALTRAPPSASNIRLASSPFMVAHMLRNLVAFAGHYDAFFTDSGAVALNDFLSVGSNNMFNDNFRSSCLRTGIRSVPNLLAFVNDERQYFRLLEFFEAASGAVRVVLKISDHTLTGPSYDKTLGLTTTTDELTVRDVVGGRDVTFGPFFKVLPFKADAETLKNEVGVIELANTLNKTSVMMFMYGFSGSGKSYTLMGDTSSNGRSVGSGPVAARTGLVYDFLSELRSGRRSVKLTSIRTLYGYVMTDWPSSALSIREVEGALGHVSAGNTTGLRRQINDFNDSFNDPLVDVMQVFERMNTVMSEALHRDAAAPSTEDDFIKSTPNNKDSSRGFMFFEFEVRTTDGADAKKLCFVDMAGNEDPYDLMIKMAPTFNLPAATGKDTVGHNYLQSQSYRHKDAIYSVFRKNLELAIRNVIRVLGPVIRPFLIVKSIENMKNVEKTIVDYIGRLTDTSSVNYIPDYFDVSHHLVHMGRYQSFIDALNFSFKVIGLRVIAMSIDTFIARLRHTFYDAIRVQTPVKPWKAHFLQLLSEGEDTLAAHVMRRENSDKKNKGRTQTNPSPGKKAQPRPSILAVSQTPLTDGRRSTHAASFDIRITVDDSLDVAILFYCVREVERLASVLKPDNGTRTVESDGGDVDVLIYRMLYVDDKREAQFSDRLRYLTLVRYIRSFALADEGRKPVEGVLVATLSEKADDAVNLTIEFALKNLDDHMSSRVSDGYMERILRESYYINQVNYELIEFFKSRLNNRPVRAYTSAPESVLDDTCLMLETYKSSQRGAGGGTDGLVGLRYRADVGERNITKITDIVGRISGEDDETKFIMLCTLRPESDVKFRTGAIQTLELVSELKST